MEKMYLGHRENFLYQNTQNILRIGVFEEDFFIYAQKQWKMG